MAGAAAEADTVETADGGGGGGGGADLQRQSVSLASLPSAFEGLCAGGPRDVCRWFDITVKVFSKPSPEGPLPGGPSAVHYVFGVPLADQLWRERAAVPYALSALMQFLEESGGIETRGIFRMEPGSEDAVQRLKTELDKGRRIAVSHVCADALVAARVIKDYLTELPEPLLPPSFVQKLSACVDSADFASRAAAALGDVSTYARATSVFLLAFLGRVAEAEPLNEMNAFELGRWLAGPTMHATDAVSVAIMQALVRHAEALVACVAASRLPQLIEGHRKKNDMQLLMEEKTVRRVRRALRRQARSREARTLIPRLRERIDALSADRASLAAKLASVVDSQQTERGSLQRAERELEALRDRAGAAVPSAADRRPASAAEPSEQVMRLQAQLESLAMERATLRRRAGELASALERADARCAVLESENASLAQASHAAALERAQAVVQKERAELQLTKLHAARPGVAFAGAGSPAPSAGAADALTIAELRTALAERTRELRAARASIGGLRGEVKSLSEALLAARAAAQSGEWFALPRPTSLSPAPSVDTAPCLCAELRLKNKKLKKRCKELLDLLRLNGETSGSAR